MEQIYAWDPDIIYITNFSRHMPEDLYENAILGHDWSTIRTVRERKIYKLPALPRFALRLLPLIQASQKQKPG